MSMSLTDLNVDPNQFLSCKCYLLYLIQPVWVTGAHNFLQIYLQMIKLIKEACWPVFNSSTKCKIEHKNTLIIKCHSYMRLCMKHHSALILKPFELN